MMDLILGIARRPVKVHARQATILTPGFFWSFTVNITDVEALFHVAVAAAISTMLLRGHALLSTTYCPNLARDRL